MLSPKIQTFKKGGQDNKENPNLRSSNFLTTNLFGPNALLEFQKSIEAEKNLLKDLKNSRSLDKNNRNYEKSYKLQVHSLLEENNQLKLDIALLKKQFQKKQEKENNQKINKNDKTNQDLKIQLNSKDSLIKELEFQISELISENRLLKIVNDTQTKTISQMEQELVKHKDLEQILEESNEEITQLKSFLHEEEVKKETLKDQINNLQAELLSQRSKLNVNSFSETFEGENILLYSFLEDSQCQNKFIDFDNQKSRQKKKLKKNFSCDLRKFRHNKHFSINSNNLNYFENQNLKESVEPKDENKKNNNLKINLKEKENMKAQIAIENFKTNIFSEKNKFLLKVLKI